MTVWLLPAAAGACAAALAIGYSLWLLMRVRRPAPPLMAGTAPASILVVVPVYNEAHLIERKLENLVQLSYPYGALDLVVVDGGSDDGTIERVEQWMADRSDLRFLRTRLRNKTAQLRVAMNDASRAEWVLVTDCDAQLAPDTLLRLTEAVRQDRSIGVVGAAVRPADGHRLEQLHWRLADRLRSREYRSGSASIVTAPCYLARRDLLRDLPADVVADDVHVAFRAATARARIGIVDGGVSEMRAPQTLPALLQHKQRKADAYLREIVRFVPHAGEMLPAARAIFFWRAALLTIAPLLLMLAAAAAALGLATADSRTLLIGTSAAVLAAAATAVTRPGRAVLQLAVLAGLLVVAAAWAVVAYPFSRQTASFPKIVQVAPTISEQPK